MSIQWGRVLLAALLMELILFAIAIPLNLIGATRAELYSLPPAAFIATFAVTVWLGQDCVEARPTRRAHRRGRHTHVRGSHAWGAGTMAIPARQRIEGYWRRRWWSGPGAAAADPDKSAADGSTTGLEFALPAPLEKGPSTRRRLEFGPFDTEQLLSRPNGGVDLFTRIFALGL
jgi:hypothetical protein